MKQLDSIKKYIEENLENVGLQQLALSYIELCFDSLITTLREEVGTLIISNIAVQATKLANDRFKKAADKFQEDLKNEQDT